MRHEAVRTLTLVTAWTLFAFFCVTPILWMLVGSAESFGMGTGVFVDMRLRSLMVNSLTLGIGVSVLTLVVGAPVGIVLARCDPHRIWLLRLLLAVPLVLPSYVLGLAWLVMFGASNSAWLHSMPAAIVVLSFSLFPIVMLATESALRTVPAPLEEAGRITAHPVQVFVRITLPLIAATVAASLLIVFVLAISDFAVPGLLRVRTYTTEVFTAFAALYDFGRATAIALPLAALAGCASIAALLVAGAVAGRNTRSQRSARWDGVTQRIAVASVLFAAILVVGAPIAAVALEARGGRAAYADVFSVEAVRNSVVWSALGASLVILVGTVLGYSQRAASSRRATIIDGLWVTLFAVPATVVGIGIIAFYNRPGLLGAIYQTEAIVAVAYLSRFLPIGALLCGAFLRRVPRAVEEAADVSGASFLQVLTRIVIPMSRGGLAAAWLMIFILMLGDVALAILVAPPGESNLPVRAYTLIANSQPGDVARLAVVQMAVTIPPLLGLGLIARHQERT